MRSLEQDQVCDSIVIGGAAVRARRAKIGVSCKAKVTAIRRIVHHREMTPTISASVANIPSARPHAQQGFYLKLSRKGDFIIHRKPHSPSCLDRFKDRSRLWNRAPRKKFPHPSRRLPFWRFAGSGETDFPGWIGSKPFEV
ncbi:MAG TPA: hypothetical protein VMJ31_08755 [Methylocystis sp.]|nr:hypothetical protein [Methylocystis sp.]